MADSFPNAVDVQRHLTGSRVSRRRLLTIGAAASVAAVVTVATPIRGLTASTNLHPASANQAQDIPQPQHAAAYYFC
jgi:hypothetical protein